MLHKNTSSTASKLYKSWWPIHRFVRRENDTPFGQAIQDVLEHTLDLTEKMGFSTYLDPEGYYGYAEIGQGDELLAVLCHLDVVPAGDLDKWESPPFEAIIKDQQLVGRGVQDDKGPSMMALFALKALLDAGLTLKNASALFLEPMRRPSGAV